MYFDFGDGHPDLQRLPRALSPREGIFVGIIIHLLVIILALVLPRTEWARSRAKAAEAARAAIAERQQASRIEPFMMAQPRVDIEALRPPPRAPLSDRDRMAMTRERPPNPTNQQPFSRGNTRQPEEAAPPSTSPPPGAPTPPVESAGTNGDRENLPREAQTGYVVPDRGAEGTGPASNSTVASRIPPGRRVRSQTRSAICPATSSGAAHSWRTPTAAASTGSPSSSTRRVWISARGSARSRRRSCATG